MLRNILIAMIGVFFCSISGADENFYLIKYAEDVEPALGDIIPADYRHPAREVLDTGHLRHELRVEIDPGDDLEELRQVLSFDAPSWARMMLVQFTPDHADEPRQEAGDAGLYLRPHRPFVDGTFGDPNMENAFVLSEVMSHARHQAAYRSETYGVPGVTQYILVTRDMDPAPADKSWHVAVGKLVHPRNRHYPNPVRGTLRVWFSSSKYRAPLAIQLYYNKDEELEQRGLFDPTPRTPNGDNPGKTIGEAWRWLIRAATEELLEELDFVGAHPLGVHVSIAPGTRSGAAASGPALNLNGPSPGRLRALHQATSRDWFNGEHIVRYQGAPRPVYEREAGTDTCRAVDKYPDTTCTLVERGPGGHLVPVIGGTSIYFSYALGEWEESMGYDFNLHPNDERSRSTSRTVKHELLHALGFSDEILLRNSYAQMFDPPRRAVDAPNVNNIAQLEEAESPWAMGSIGGQRMVRFIGPRAVHNPYNPWRHTDVPGIPLSDKPSSQYGNHLGGDWLWEYEADDIGVPWINWEHDFAMGGTGSDRSRRTQPLVSRDMLLDSGYALNTLAIQERSLPRHWLDPDHDGHGVDLRRVEHADGSMRHFLHFYTHSSQGRPEWYIADAELKDEVVFEADLLYMTWGGSQPVPDPARSGTIRLDLDPPIDHPACAERRKFQPSELGQEDPQGYCKADPNSSACDQAPIANPFNGRDPKWLFAVMDFDLPDGSGQWCLEPLEFGRQPAIPHEGSGSWFASDDNDSGWGLSVMTRNWGHNPIINTVAYYYNSLGEPTWAQGVAGGDYRLPYRSVGEGVKVDMFHVNAACRTCDQDGLSHHPAGHIELRINEQATEAHHGNHIIRLDLTDQDVGGQWLREDVGIRLLSSPHPDMYQ